MLIEYLVSVRSKTTDWTVKCTGTYEDCMRYMCDSEVVLQLLLWGWTNWRLRTRWVEV